MALTDDPAVLAWQVALSPRPRPEPIGRHWWRELVTEAWRAALDAWEAKREEVAIGYATEMREFEEQFPRPRLADFMVHLSNGHDPGEVLQW